VAAFIDAEHALDPGYAKKIGVNLEELVVSQPNSGEEALAICEQLVKSAAVDVVVVDSVAALTPQAEIDGEMGDSHVGLQARLMSQAMRKLTGALSRANTLCIFTNQVREKIGVMFGNPETTPGGKALKFYATCRLQVQRIGAIKSAAGEIVGNRTRVKVVKNKVAAPFTEAEFDILYSCGISREGSVVDAALARGVVERRGSWLAFGTEQLGQGTLAAIEYLKERPEVLERIIEAVKSAPLLPVSSKAKK
jgi:recombination protein RecA